MIHRSSLLVLIVLVPAMQAQAPRQDLWGDDLPENAIARCGTLRSFLNPQLTALALSPDGKLVALCSKEPCIDLWEVPSRKPVGQLVTDSDQEIFHIDFSPDGKTLASAEREGGTCHVRLWSVPRRKLVTQCFVPSESLAFVFSPDSKMLAIIAPKKDVQLRDLASGREIKLLIVRDNWQTGAFSPDGCVLALAGTTGGIRLVDIHRDRQLGLLQGHTDSVSALTFSRDGKLLASSGTDSTLRLWDVSQRKQLSSRKLGTTLTKSIVFSPDSKTLVLDIGDNTLARLDVSTLKPIVQRRLEGSPIVCVSFAADGRMAAFGQRKDFFAVRFLEMEKRQEPLLPPKVYLKRVEALAFSPDGKMLVTGSRFRGDPGICLWQSGTGKLLREVRGHTDGVHSVGFLDNRTLVTTGRSTDSTVRFWDVVKGKQTHIVAMRTEPDSPLVASPDGKLLAGVEVKRESNKDGDRYMHRAVVRDATRKLLHSLPWQSGRIGSLAFSPDAHQLAIATDAEFFSRGVFEKDYITVWDLRSGAPCWSHRDIHGGPHLVFSGDGWLLASAGSRSFQVCDALTGEELFSEAWGKGIRTLAIAPANDLLALADEFGVIHLYDLDTCVEVAELRGHPNENIWCMSFSPTGDLLASGGESTALVWDVAAVRKKLERPTRLTPEQVPEFWNTLGSTRTMPAYRAGVRLAGSPAEALPFLKKMLRPAPRFDRKRISQLIADLDSNRFAVRQQAMAELSQAREAAAPAVRQALLDRPSLEMRRRLELLLRQFETWPPELLRSLRAVHLLERMGTPESRNLLETLARGDPEATLTRQARSALDRIRRLQGGEAGSR